MTAAMLLTVRLPVPDNTRRRSKGIVVWGRRSPNNEQVSQTQSCGWMKAVEGMNEL